MSDLVTEVGDGVWVLPGAVSMSIIRAPGGRSVLVDTGQDDSYARKLLRASRELGLEPAVILNTHAHADHFGGNAFLLKRLEDVQVMAPAFEAAFIRQPSLEPLYLAGGGLPLRELTGKWTQATPSRVDTELLAGPTEIAGRQIVLHDVPGHATSMFAVQVDDVLLAADALMGQELLERYPLPYGHDPLKQMESAAGLGTLSVRLTVVGHGPVSDDVAGLADVNVQALERVRQAVLNAADGLGTEDVLARVAAETGASHDDIVRYHLNLGTVRGWLAALRETGELAAEVSGGRLVWSSAALR